MTALWKTGVLTIQDFVSYRQIRKLIALLLAFALAFTLVPPKDLLYPPVASAASLNPPSNAAEWESERIVEQANHFASLSQNIPGALNNPAQVAQVTHALMDLVEQGNPLIPPNIGQLASTEQSEATPPLSISRVQSAYRPADLVESELVITFTVTNNQPPTVAVPELPISPTLTDTLTALQAIGDFSKDPNTIQNVLLTDALTAHATFVASSASPDQRGNEYAWNLGHLAPMQSVTLTLNLQVAPGVAPFAPLDAGASVWGTLQNHLVHASARPINLVADSIDGEPSGQWLKWTVDADTFDEYMLEKAAELGQDPLLMYDYVRSLGYESYKGSLRGTRGTLWSQAGNSLDHSSLLVAMLRSAAVPARYVRGTLPEERVQSLILSMFPQSSRLVGHVPPGAAVADPLRDPQLLAEGRDHWWVQAYLDGQWVDLDPSFDDAQPGERFTNPVATYDEVPDELRHKVVVRLKVESYYGFTSLGNELPLTYPLSTVFNTVELAGNPVTLGHLVNTNPQGGFVFYALQHSYTPYLSIGSRIIQGQPYQELISNFPFGNVFITGEWLQIEVHHGDGNIEIHEREIVDRLGFAARESGGTVAVTPGEGTDPVVDELDNYTVLLAPGRISREALLRESTTFLAGAPAINEALQVVNELRLMGQADTPEALLKLREVRNLIKELVTRQNRIHLLYFCFLSDDSADQVSNMLLVKAYHTSPRILISSSAVTSDTMTQIFDLRSNPIRVLAYPSQITDIPLGFQSIRGLIDTRLEEQVMAELMGIAPLSAIGILEQAKREQIKFVFIDSSRLTLLAKMDISQEAKSRILHAVRHELGVVVPETMVVINGRSTIAWWQINPETGNITGVGEDGNHFTEYSTVNEKGAVETGAVVMPRLAGMLAPMATYILYAGFLIGGILIGYYSFPEIWRLSKETLVYIREIVRQVNFVGSYGP